MVTVGLLGAERRRTKAPLYGLLVSAHVFPSVEQIPDNTGEAQTLTWSQFSTTEWSDDKATVSTSGLESMACPNPAIVKLRTKFTPSLSSVGGITSAPVVDITTMSFVAGVAAEEDAEVRKALEKMREGALTKLPEHLTPSY
jgi:hypothetical protein